MTDHRVSDLSYGQLGEASYNVDESNWSFSIEPGNDQYLQQLLPFKQALPPSIQNAPEIRQSASRVARSNLKWLAKAHPEAIPANAITSAAISGNPTPTPTTFHHTVSTLLVVGQALNVDHMSGSRPVQILAMPCGEAGHVLRLIRPGIEKCEWGKYSGAKLLMADPTSSEQGHWVGSGGSIHQIAFADDLNGSASFFAVRQATVITIFRPIYRKVLTPFMAPSGYPKTYPPSRLSANPVAALSAERTGSGSHVDISFNPWYTRQFAVVDELGSWSLWDIEGRNSKHSAMEVIPGRSGQIYHDHVSDPTLKGVGGTDGWHRILWAGSVSTIIVCNRRHLAVFDVKATAKRLPCAELLPATNSEWILDVKRSAVNLNHLFVLTTSRIFWIEVKGAGDEKDGHEDVGANVILSYRHFRDASDETMKLAVLNDENITVLISSAKSLLLNFYSFSATPNSLATPTSSRGSITLSGSLQEQESGHRNALQTLCVLPVALLPNHSTGVPGSELQYIEQGVKFYQILTLTSVLGLSSTLCALHRNPPRRTTLVRYLILPPTTKAVISSSRSRHQLVTDDSFVVPDLQDEENRGQFFHHDEQFIMKQKSPDNFRMGINWQRIFRHVFISDGTSHYAQQVESLPSLGTMETALERIKDHVERGKEQGNLPMATLLELGQLKDFTEDLEQAALILHLFLESLQLEHDLDAPSTLIISNLTSYHTTRLPTSPDSKLPDLLKVYDQLAENWMASLPLRVSGPARFAKFKVIRRVAAELSLGSISVSLRKKSSQVADISIGNVEEAPAMNLLKEADEMSRAHSPALVSSQINRDPSQGADFSLPTPTKTPSLYSHKSTDDSTEDLAIFRLRQYTVLVESRPDLVTPGLLSHWPSSPGIDPAKYSWQETFKANEEGDENNRQSRREEARQRRRTERSLNRERANATNAESQPVSISFGSQPEVGQHVTSSQTVKGLPMTQPDRGAFGRRSVFKKKTKPKKRRAAGF